MLFESTLCPRCLISPIGEHIKCAGVKPPKDEEDDPELCPDCGDDSTDGCVCKFWCLQCKHCFVTLSCFLRHPCAAVYPIVRPPTSWDLPGLSTPTATLTGKSQSPARTCEDLIRKHVLPIAPVPTPIDPGPLATYQDIRKVYGETCDAMEALVKKGILDINALTPGACPDCFENARKKVELGPYIKVGEKHKGSAREKYGRIDHCGLKCAYCEEWRRIAKCRAVAEVHRVASIMHSATTSTTGSPPLPTTRSKGCFRFFLTTITMPPSAGPPDHIRNTIITNIGVFTAAKKSFTTGGYYGVIEPTSINTPHCYIIFKIVLPTSETGTPLYRPACSNLLFRRLGRYRENGVGNYKGCNGEGVITRPILAPYQPNLDKIVNDHMKKDSVEFIGTLESIFNTN